MNRQNFPSSLFPLRGDLSAEAGDVKVTVVGLQTIPIDSTTPVDGNTLIVIDGVWIPVTPNSTVYVDTLPISSDWTFYVNGVDLDVVVNWPYTFAFQVWLNGVGVTGS